MMRVFLVFLATLAFVLTVAAEGAAATLTETEVGQLLTDAEKLQAENDSLRRKIAEQEGPIWNKYVETKQLEYEFHAEMMKVNTRNFGQQYVASYVILFLVVCIVLGGLWFAYIQLKAGLAPVAAAMQATKTQAAGEEAPTPGGPVVGIGSTIGFDASLQKVSVTSSVVGVVVLVISLAFLYIYTREVYRIQIIDPYRPKVLDPDATPADQASKPKPTKTAD